MDKTYQITIDGKACTARHGEFLWDVAKRNGVHIPALCRSDRFEEHRACCRVCIVEVTVRGRTKVVTSCVYPVEGECQVVTDSPRIRQERKVLMALLAARAPESDVIRNMASFMGAGEGYGRLKPLDTGKCILCGLCVQACESMGTGAISTVNRGTEKEVNTPYGMASDACIGCLSCANVCPTGAIEYQQDEETRTIWNRTFPLARCSQCGQVMDTVDMAEFETCDECRKKAIADQLAQAYRFV
ncbi:MAG: 2Fe-2S iron-sulfur cluster-binding protein [Coriobacteriia bacterium]|nr:2Fe-2S iron-sulfur cluster-binding protein [Coriobacteriia bacterium]